MSIQTINIGTSPNDGTGDSLRVGGDKINDNFLELYSARIIKFYDGRVVGRNIDVTMSGYTPLERDVIQVLPDSAIEEGTTITLSVNEGTSVEILGYTSHTDTFSIILTYLTDYWGLLGRQSESYAVSGVNTGDQDISAMTHTNRAALDLVSGTNTGDQTLPVKATGAELNTGTDDAKFATAKALKDGEFIGIHVGTTAPADTTKLWLDTN